MVSPISSTLAEIYLHLFEELTDMGWRLEKYHTTEDMQTISESRLAKIKLTKN